MRCSPAGGCAQNRPGHGKEVVCGAECQVSPEPSQPSTYYHQQQSARRPRKSSSATRAEVCKTALVRGIAPAAPWGMLARCCTGAWLRIVVRPSGWQQPHTQLLVPAMAHRSDEKVTWSHCGAFACWQWTLLVRGSGLTCYTGDGRCMPPGQPPANESWHWPSPLLFCCARLQLTSW
jgi:hypothetical protein